MEDTEAEKRKLGTFRVTYKERPLSHSMGYGLHGFLKSIWSVFSWNCISISSMQPSFSSPSLQCELLSKCFLPRLGHSLVPSSSLLWWSVWVLAGKAWVKVVPVWFNGTTTRDLLFQRYLENLSINNTLSIIRQPVLEIFYCHWLFSLSAALIQLLAIMRAVYGIEIFFSLLTPSMHVSWSEFPLRWGLD